MTKREQFKKAVIEAIHGLQYEEAIKEEVTEACGYCHDTAYSCFRGLPITIGRVMQALNGNLIFRRGLSHVYIHYVHNDDNLNNLKGVGRWKLTKDGIELDDDAQSDETIEALLKLLTNRDYEK